MASKQLRSQLSMNGFALACVAAVAFFFAAACPAQVDLGFPREPEREVRLPGRGAFTGARLFAPEGAGPFPAVVISHTCGPLRQHIFEWAQRFVAASYVVLAVDHLGPRRLTMNCGTWTVSVTEYAQDAVAAMLHLRALPFVDAKRISMIGLSYGAMAGLRAASESFRAKHLGGERFAAIVSLYPWCNQRLGRVHRDHQWNFYDDTTTLLLVLSAQMTTRRIRARASRWQRRMPRKECPSSTPFFRIRRMRSTIRSWVTSRSLRSKAVSRSLTATTASRCTLLGN
jgi:dienelactone hydrolase